MTPTVSYYILQIEGNFLFHSSGRSDAFARRCDGFSALERRFFGARATSSATKSSLTPKSSLTDPSYIVPVLTESRCQAREIE
jgi:hypothetical protein